MLKLDMRLEYTPVSRQLNEGAEMPHHDPTGHWSVPLASPPEIARAKRRRLIHQIHCIGIWPFASWVQSRQRNASRASSRRIIGPAPPLFASLPSALICLVLPLLSADLGFGWQSWLASVVWAVNCGAAAILPVPSWVVWDGWVAESAPDVTLH